MAAVLAALQQWILFSGFTFAVGCVAWRTLVAPRAAGALLPEHRPGLAAIERRVAMAGAATGLILIGAWMLKMVVQVMGFRDPFVPLWEDVSFLLFETFWGTVWMAQGIIIPLLTIAFWRAGASSAGASKVAGASNALMSSGPPPPPAARIGRDWRAATILALALAVTLSLSSHAMGVESWRPLLVTADAAHAIAAGTWIGSLGLILTVGRPAQGGPAGLDLFGAQLRSFSPVAIVSVTVLLSMGAVLAWTHLTALSDLWTMTYGRILSAKIGGAAAVMAVGFVNWRKGIPALDNEAGARATYRRAAWEVSLAVGVLLLTAILVHSPKP